MDEREFVTHRAPAWDRLASILAAAGKAGGLRRLTREDLQALGSLYRRAASDLAFVRSQNARAALVQRLNALVATGYSVIYQGGAQKRRPMSAFFTELLPGTFRRRIWFFVASVGITAVGALAAYQLELRYENTIYLLLPKGSNLHDSIQYWKTGKVTRTIHDSEGAAMAAFLMTNNIKVAFMCFVGGLTGGLLTTYILFSNGMVLGAMAGLMTRVNRHAIFWPAIVPHGVVEISVICVAGAAGLAVGWSMLAPGRLRRRDALAEASRDSLTLVLGGALMLIFAGLTEAYISHSQVPGTVKLVYGVASGVVMYGYFAFAGRTRRVAGE